MHCPSCEIRKVAVTLDTIVGTHTVCRECAFRSGNAAFIQAIEDTDWLERFWKRDSSKVQGDGHVVA